MIVPDVNLLLYAEIADFPQHAAARAWWESLLSGHALVGLCPPSVLGFVRLATNRRVFERPLSIETADARVHAWLARPNVRALTPGPDHFERIFRLLRSTGTGGSLCTDAEIAAYAQAVDGVVHTNDTDFGRFADVRHVNPLK